jgi:hypothetical protein
MLEHTAAVELEPFVLHPETDAHARAALRAYARSVIGENKALARDIYATLRPYDVEIPQRTEVTIVASALRQLLIAARAAARHGTRCAALQFTTSYAKELEALVDELMCANCHGRAVRPDAENVPRPCAACAGTGLA